MIFDNFIKNLQSKYGDNLIVRNNKVLGICECNGKGKGRCRGNGWAKHSKENIDDEPAFDFNKCKYIKPIAGEENI